jgi:hypothetical protein
MTAPKHIPLTARMKAYAEHKAEELRHLLQVPDDARDVAAYPGCIVCEGPVDGGLLCDHCATCADCQGDEE